MVTEWYLEWICLRYLSAGKIMQKNVFIIVELNLTIAAVFIDVSYTEISVIIVRSQFCLTLTEMALAFLRSTIQHCCMLQ
jgi:hypothetical protein